MLLQKNLDLMPNFLWRALDFLLLFNLKLIEAAFISEVTPLHTAFLFSITCDYCYQCLYV